MNTVTITRQLTPFANQLTDAQLGRVCRMLLAAMNGEADESALQKTEILVYHAVLLMNAETACAVPPPVPQGQEKRRRGRPRKERPVRKTEDPSVSGPRTVYLSYAPAAAERDAGKHIPSPSREPSDPAAVPDPAPGTAICSGSEVKNSEDTPLPFPAGPTQQEVEQYARERASRVDPRRFFEYNRERAWMVNGVPMRDWKALFRTWESWERSPCFTAEKHSEKVPRAAQYTQRHYTAEDLNQVTEELIREAIRDSG